MSDDERSHALRGIRVLDLGILVQAPQAGALLSDMGADVIKVELPGIGDMARWIPVSIDDFRAPYFVANNRGKRSVALDLRTEAGREAFHRLVATADVVLSNFKPGTLDEWQLGYETLAKINPRIIWAAGSAFGARGPDASLEGADLAGQARGGIISTIGEDGTPLSPIGVTISDHVASVDLAAGVLAALFVRERTGRGQKVEVSLFGGQIWAQASELTAHFLGRPAAVRANRGHPRILAIYGIFKTADGWIAMVGVPGKLRQRFFEALERPDLGSNPEFAGELLTPEQLKVLMPELAGTFSQRTTAEWEERLRAAGQRYAPVQDYDALERDPQAWANGYLFSVDHPQWGRKTMIGVPIEMSETPLVPGRAVPELGQHTEEVLLEAGLTWEEIDALRGRGAFG